MEVLNWDFLMITRLAETKHSSALGGSSFKMDTGSEDSSFTETAKSMEAFAMYDLITQDVSAYKILALRHIGALAFDNQEVFDEDEFGKLLNVLKKIAKDSQEKGLLSEIVSEINELSDPDEIKSKFLELITHLQ
jgi:hypothetical protein